VHYCVVLVIFVSNFEGVFLVWMQGYWIQVGVGGWNALTDLDFLLQLVETASSLQIDI
jgi:hypothetical protein